MTSIQFLEVDDNNKKKKKKMKKKREWRCIDYLYWMIGYMCITWWVMSLMYSCLPCGFQMVEMESPGIRLKREGVKVNALHPVVLVPGILTGGLELWEGKPCAQDLFRKTIWGSGGSFAEILKRPLCWLEHLSLHNETGLDPPGIRVRAVHGLLSGAFAWDVLIENLARIGYEGKNLHMADYDWRLSFQNTEIRDQALSRLKSKIELMFVTNGFKKVVVVPHSTGSLYFLHFLKWVETPSPMGGHGGPGWCDKHIKAIMNISPAFLGVPKVVSSLFSAEAKEVAFVRAMARGILNSGYLGIQTLEHVMRMCRTWDSIISLMPKGGETIWGNLDLSPEQRRKCDSFVGDNRCNRSTSKKGFKLKEHAAKYGRIISFRKEASQLPSSLFVPHDFKEISSSSDSATLNLSCGEARMEYDEMNSESIRKVAEMKSYTSTIFYLLRSVAPKMMKRAESHFSHGIAEDLGDPEYNHHKYWSNPLETKLPEAPNMEIYCLYGVGDESMPVVSAGFMCAKGWRRRTRFNPSGISAFVREFRHKQQPHSSLLHGMTGLESVVAHINIMGNFELVEDVLRVVAGANGTEIGGDRILSDILRTSERINLKL